MNKEEAQAWLAARYPADRVARLEHFVRLLHAEAERQSLIARSTFDSIWSRHIVDSAQLLAFAGEGIWLDVGSGGGLPGLVIAVLRDNPVILSEPRRKRAAFLREAADLLRLENTSVVGRVQDVELDVGTVSARAVASINEIFDWTDRAVSRETRYLLQRGRGWKEDMAVAQRTWQGMFHVEHSIVDPESRIVIAESVRQR